MKLGTFKVTPIIGLLGCGGLVFLLVVLIGGCSVAVGYSTYTTGKNKEIDLSSAYKSNQNELSAYFSKYTSSISLVQGQTDALDKVLTDAVMAQFPHDQNGNTSNTPGTLFYAVHQAYPELSLVELQKSWNEILKIVDAGVTAFKNKQDDLTQQINAYDHWRNNGVFRQLIIATPFVDFPSSHLEAEIGGEILTGEAAYRKMKRLVLDSNAQDSFKTGTLNAPTVPKDTK